MASATTDEEEQPDVFSSLLFRLPAELRLEIYSHALDLPNRTHIDCLADERSIQWLTHTPTIFHEAAPLLYGTTPLHFAPDFRYHTRGQSLSMLFHSHVESTFLHDRRWAEQNVPSVVTKIEINVPTLHAREESIRCNRKGYDSTTDSWFPTAGYGGFLESAGFILHQGLPPFPAVKTLTLRFAHVRAWPEETNDLVEEVWDGTLDAEMYARLVRHVPAVRDYVECVTVVNEEVRAAWPSLREVRWEAQVPVEGWQRRRRGMEEKLYAAKCKEALISWVGHWRAEEEA